MEKYIAELCPFSELCNVLEAISSKRKPEQKRKILKQFIHYWRNRHDAIHKDTKTDDSFYSAMRLILPSFDKERGAYGFKEHMLAKKLIEILMMDKNGNDAQRLLHYQSPMNDAKSSGTGDFASVAAEILKFRVSKTSTLNLDEVNRRLDAIAIANASKDKATIDTELEWLCRKVGTLELKWLIRILLKQMKIGMQETTVLNLFHPDASQLYDVSTSLLKVCQTLHSLNTRMDAIEIQLFVPFRPMLANRSAPEKVPEIMGQKPYFVEIKYDGERVQLHKNGNQYKYYSRNGNEFTSSYGAGPLEGSFTPYIHKAFQGSVKNCIIDGEMVGWNPEAKCIATKGDHFDVKALKDGDDLHPCFVAFDLLLLNDEVLTLKPLEKRLETLKNSIFNELEGRLIQAERSIKTTEKELIDCLNDAIERREEGIVVKRMDSTYRLNTRTNEAGWLKIKPDYIDNVCDDLDLLIIGGYFGDGRRSNLLSHFLLGLRDKNTGSDENPRFLSMCKVGSGYSMKELYDLNVHLNANCALKRGKPPDWCVISGEKPDAFVEPKNSKVLQIRAAEIAVSKSFSVGYTLRFPRVEKIRDDKNWNDAMTVDEFEKLRIDCAGKLSKKLKTSLEGEDGPSSPKKRKVVRTMVPRPMLGVQFKAASLKKVKKVCEVFSGKEFCVLNGSEEFDKEKLEIKIREMGGSIVQHADTKTFCVIAAKRVLKMTLIIDAKLTNVANADWLIRCIKEQRCIPWTPSDLWFAMLETEQAFAKDFDEFGDSFTNPINEEELRKVFLNVPIQELTPVEIAEIEFEYIPDYRYGLFRRCRVYLDQYLAIGDVQTKVYYSPLELAGCALRLFGATLTTNVDDCTHVVIHSKYASRLKTLMELNRERQFKFHIINEKWIRECINENTLLTERLYQPSSVTV